MLQEILKVRGFQVAPAELEGHLLDHPDVADVCVVGIPDEYSGEVPLAFVTLEASTAERVQKNPSEADKVKASISKVRSSVIWLFLIPHPKYTPACIRREGAVQMACGRGRILGCNPQEPERQALASLAQGKGERDEGPWKAP